MKKTLIIWLATLVAAAAQEGVVKTSKEAHLAILAIGAKPSIKYVIPKRRAGISRNIIRKNAISENLKRLNQRGAHSSDSELNKLAGDAMIVDFHPDQIPPSVLYTKEMNGGEVRLRVGFNNSVSFVRVPAAKTLELRRSVALGEVDTKMYLKMRALLPGSRTLAILKPISKPPGVWRGMPQCDLINLDAAFRSNKKILILNQSSHELHLALAREVLRIGVGDKLSLDLPSSKSKYTRFKVMKAGGSKQFVARGISKFSSSSLNLYVFYDANPKTNNGKMVGVFRKIIPLPPRIVENP